MFKKGIWLVFFLVLASGASATTYYVDGGVSDCGTYDPSSRSCGSGSYQAFNTIDEGENAATQPGDIVYVRSGTYDERVYHGNSGSAGNYITFVGYPGDAKPVMRGFDITNQSYVRIIGFEITHLNWGSPTHSIFIGGGSHYIEILDNYIHHVGHNDGGQAIRLYPGDHYVIRGNEITRSSCSDGEGACGCNGYGMGGHWDTHYVLAEYNHIHGIGSDFMDFLGSYSIGRNNYMYDVDESLWSCLPHVDFFQAGSDGMATNVMYHVYESNFMGDNPYEHSHTFQMRDSTNTGDHNMIIRGNIAYNIGSYVQQAGGIDNVFHYNNAYYRIVVEHQDAGGGVINHNVEHVNNPSIGNYIFNNIIYDIGNNYPFGTDGTSAGSGSDVNISDNLCYLTLSHSECSTANPLFVNAGSNDFHLQSGSPAIGLGKEITTVTSPTGSGSSFDVADAGFFTDGYGIVEGDIIKVGTNAPVRISNIASNTITVESSINWNNGDGVYWRNQDTSPDIGAYEYRSGGYDYDIGITSPTNGATVSGAVPIIATSSNSEVIRYVLFYVDGIPVGQDFDSPYEYTWVATGDGNHVIEARAYNLYASTTLWESDSVTVSVGGPAVCVDVDGDGFNVSETDCGVADCDDDNSSIFPGATEICDDGIDQDCDGSDLPCQQGDITITTTSTFKSIGIRAVFGQSIPDTSVVSLFVDDVAAHSLSRISATEYAGSAMFLDPGTQYDLRVTASNPALQGTIISSTRSESFPDYAVTYYVSTTGNDANSGSSSQPFQTIQHALDVVSSGQKIVVRPGVYYETLTISDDDIILEGETGAIIDGSDPGFSTLGGWQSEGSGVYSKYLGYSTLRTYYNDRHLYPYSSLGGLQGLVANVEGAFTENNRLYVRLPGDNDPDGTNIKVSRFVTGINLQANNVQVRNFEIRFFGQAGGHSGIDINGDYNLIEDCYLHHNVKGINFRGGADYNVVQNNEFSNTPLYDWHWGTGKPGVFESGSVYFGNANNPTRGNIINGNEIHDAFEGSHLCSDLNHIMYDIDYYDNHLYNIMDDGIETDGSCNNIRIFNNLFEESLGAISIAPVSPGLVYIVGNEIINMHDQWRDAAHTDTYAGIPIKFNVYTELVTRNIFIYHNTIYSSYTQPYPQEGLNIFTGGETGMPIWENVVFRNNIIYGQNIAIANSATFNDIDFDYDNLYTNPSETRSLVYWNGPYYDTLQEFRSATGLEIHGLNDDPGFLNMNTQDFTLSATSPLIDQGIHIPGINDDYVGSAPDIGAWEYGEISPSNDADLNNDGDVNIIDLVLFAKFFFAGDMQADLDNDGLLTLNDFLVLNAGYD